MSRTQNKVAPLVTVSGVSYSVKTRKKTGIKTINEDPWKSKTFNPSIESLADTGSNPGGQNPCLHVKISRRWLPHRIHFNWEDAYYTYVGYFDQTWNDGSNFSDANTAPVWTRDLNQDIVQQCDVAVGNCQLAVSALEIAQTLKMLKSPFKAIKQLQKLTRRNRYLWNRLRSMPVKEALDLASSTFLSWRYGWRPFISDVESITKANKRIREGLKRAREMQQHMTTLHAREKVHHTIVRASPSGPRWECTRYRDCTSERILTVRCVVTPPPEPVQMARAIQKYFQLDKLASTVWEVIPFSFVVDWFLPIGPALERFSVSPAGSPKVYLKPGTLTTITRELKEIEAYDTIGSPSSNGRFTPVLTVWWREFTRTYDRKQAVAAPPPDGDRFWNRWTKLRTADASALAFQQLAGTFKIR